jgi:GNAT superfamily N-acetyltransferase
MTGFTLQRIRRPLDWLRIYRLYRRAFPREERKPFGIICRMHRAGRTDVWILRQGGCFAGFASTVNGDGVILLDYLAVPERLRGQGAGSAALATLCRAYPGQGLFVEIESPFTDADNRAERLRRRAFYERSGFLPARTMADVFGVPMELLCHGCTLDFAAYHHFYRTYYSAWAAQHITPLPYPNE